jgi:hypothetical protein
VPGAPCEGTSYDTIGKAATATAEIGLPKQRSKLLTSIRAAFHSNGECVPPGISDTATERLRSQSVAPRSQSGGPGDRISQPTARKASVRGADLNTWSRGWYIDAAGQQRRF